MTMRATVKPGERCHYCGQVAIDLQAMLAASPPPLSDDLCYGTIQIRPGVFRCENPAHKHGEDAAGQRGSDSTTLPSQEGRVTSVAPAAPYDDLERRLRAMSRHEHDDLTIGDEAADALAALRGEVERLKLDAGHLWHALKDLSFDCDGVTQTQAPQRGTYNSTFALLTVLSSEYETAEHYQNRMANQAATDRRP